jgi:hypothetical protein
MYQPTLGRFLSRDPLSENGVDVLTDTGFYSHRLTAMRDNPWYYGGNWENPYVYGKNNPVKLVDASGLLCEIDVHCYPAISEVSGGFVGTHCGLTITDATHTYWIDGQWQSDGLRIRGNRTPRTNYTVRQSEKANFADSVCKCVNDYIKTFNAAKIPYEAVNRNSNWALKCLSAHCGIQIAWNGNPPTGWNAEVWVTERYHQWGNVYVCLPAIRPAPCP